MATSLSNETSMASLVEFSSDSMLSAAQTAQDAQTYSSKSGNPFSRGECSGTNQSPKQSAIAATSSSNQTTTTSYSSSRGDSNSASSRFHQQQQSLMSNVNTIAYPLFTGQFFGFPPSSNQSQYNYQNQGVGNGGISSGTTASTNQPNRRGGKKKSPAIQQQNAEYRLFFCLRRRDASNQPSRAQSQIYKLKTPPSIQEWFKKLSVEERVNALTTVYPRLSEIYMNMQQKIDSKGQCDFALQDASQPYYDYKPTTSYSNPYYQNYSSGYDHEYGSFDKIFYVRQQNETEILKTKQSQKESEQEIIRNIRLTDYINYLDTLTVTEELVQDPERFFRVITEVTAGHAFANPCVFKPFSQAQPSDQEDVIERPQWFNSPRSFHSFALWLAITLEENLWAQYEICSQLYSYNFDNNVHLGSAKANELSCLFREKADIGAQDVDINTLTAYWISMSEGKRKNLQSQLYNHAYIKIESWDGKNEGKGLPSAKQTIHRTTHSKTMHSSVIIKERSHEKSYSQQQVDAEVHAFIDKYVNHLQESDMIKELIYSYLHSHPHQVIISRAFLDLIKKHYKDDLMENLLMEEQTTKLSKQADLILTLDIRNIGSNTQGQNVSSGQSKKKKKQKKEKKDNIDQNQLPQQSSKANPSNNQCEKNGQSSSMEENTEQITEDKQKTTPRKKNKFGMQAVHGSDKQGNLQTNQQQNAANLNKKKKKGNQGNNRRNSETATDVEQNQGNGSNLQESFNFDENQDTVKEINNVQEGAESNFLEQKSYQLLLSEEHSSRQIDVLTKIKNKDEKHLYESNNSNATSVATLSSNKLGSNDKLQQDTIKGYQLSHLSKSKSYNNSKQQTKQSKIETKNYQILQNSQETLSEKNQKSKPAKDHTQIFSEDDKDSFPNEKTASEKYDFSENEQSEDVIKQYVLELTLTIVDEVCKRSESSNTERAIHTESRQENNEASVPEYFKIGAVQPQNHSADSHVQQEQRKRSFYKGRKEDYKQESQQNESDNCAGHSNLRKTSFNGSKKSFKDDKKFSEDYSQIAQPAHQSQAHHNNKNNRKGFGIHLKSQEKVEETKQTTKKINDEQDQSQAWAKGVAKQPDPASASHKQKLQMKSQEDDSSSLPVLRGGASSASQSQKSQKNTDVESVYSSSQQEPNGKKRKNRKKPKVDPIEKMNSFMKNLQVDEAKVEVNKQGGQSRHSQYKKRNYPQQNQNQNQQSQQNQQQRNVKSNISEQQQMGRQNNAKKEEDVKSDIGRQQDHRHGNGRSNQYKQKVQAIQNQQNQQLSQSVKVELKFEEKDLTLDSSQVSQCGDSLQEQLPEQVVIPPSPTNLKSQAKAQQNSSHPLDQKHANKHGGNKGSKTGSFKMNGAKHQSHANQTLEEERESVQSNKAECVSEKGTKSFPQKPKCNNPSQPGQKTQAFRQLKFKQGIDWETNSMTDLTGTTNTAADSSLEILNHAHLNEEQKEAIVIQDQSNQIQVSLTDSIDASNFIKTNNLAFTLEQFSSKIIQSTMQQTLQEMHEASMIPPMIQSPPSTLSTNAQIYNPQSSTKANQHYSGESYHPKNIGYQSYNNTPSKPINLQSQISNSNPYQPKNYRQNVPLPSLSAQNSNFSQEGSTNFRTPPQLTKKPASTYQYSNNGYRGKNSQNTGGAYAGSQSHGVYEPKGVQKPPVQPYRQQPTRQQQPTFAHPQPNPLIQEQQQFYAPIYQNLDQNAIYMQDPQFMNPAQQIDMFQFKPQDQIFQYVEKNMMNNHIIHQPKPYQPVGMVGPNYGFLPQGCPNDGMMMNNNFGFQQQSQSPYQYENQQDFLLQIVNQIRFNQTSLSPIPQNIPTSPPPLIEYQSPHPQFDCLQQPPQLVDSHMMHQNEQIFYDKFDHEIRNFTQQIRDNLNVLQPERDYIYEKIDRITKQTFLGQNPKLELFGSLITGLALESSDMDLAVTGLYIEDRYAVVCELKRLASGLQDWNCLESFKCIETASIPVIKLVRQYAQPQQKVDLNKLRALEMPQRYENDFQSRHVSEEQRLLSIDITFDDSSAQPFQANHNYLPLELFGSASLVKTHLGLQSCALVQHYIANYQHLKEVSILLKKFLAIHNFNSPYYGGISSYSTVILLVAYMNYFQLKGNHNLSPSRLLMGFLDFYGNYFNANSLGISVYEDGSFYQLNSLLDSNFVILDPLNLQNNTTRNSYLTKEILQKFQCAFNNLKSLILKNPQLSNNAVSSLYTNHHVIVSSAVHSENQDSHETEKVLIPTKDGHTQDSIESPEEREARNQLKGGAGSKDCSSPFSQVHLLETFFGIDAQPATEQSRMFSAQQEPGSQSAQLADTTRS